MASRAMRYRRGASDRRPSRCSKALVKAVEGRRSGIDLERGRSVRAGSSEGQRRWWHLDLARPSRHRRGGRIGRGGARCLLGVVFLDFGCLTRITFRVAILVARRRWWCRFLPSNAAAPLQHPSSGCGSSSTSRSRAGACPLLRVCAAAVGSLRAIFLRSPRVRSGSAVLLLRRFRVRFGWSRS